MSVKELDPRVRRTRQLLQIALIELMKEKPFQSISVSDLSKRATLNRATFYLHYTDKFDLLAQSTRDTFIEMVADRMPHWDNFGVQDIRLLARVTCEYLDGFLKGCAPANKPYEPLIEAEIQQVLYDFIYCWLLSETDKEAHTLTLQTCATMISTTLLHMSLKWSRGKTTYSQSEVVNDVYLVVTSGILKVIPNIE